MTKYILAKDECKRTINTRGNLVKLVQLLTVLERARSKFISESSESKLNSSDEKEMVLKQNLEDLGYTGTISFVFYFIEQIQRND